MLNDFLDRAPVLLDHFGHVLSPLFQFMFDIFLFPLFFKLFLMQLLFARSAILFCIADLFLCFSFKIFCHPFHFLNQEIPMSFRLRLLEVLRWIYFYWSSRERVESSCTDRFLEVAKLALHFFSSLNELLYLELY